MNLVSAQFFAFAAIVIVAFHLSPAPAWRRLVLSVASACFLVSQVDGLVQLLPLFGFLLLGYGAIGILRRTRRHCFAGSILACCVVCVLAAYVVLKRFSFIAPVAQLPFPYLMLGLSYILFRVLQMMIDTASGDLAERVGPLAFFRHSCNFLCFVSGPIQRYQDFAAMDGAALVRLDADSVFRAFARVVTGCVKFVVVAASANYVFLNISAQLLAPNGAGRLAVLYAVSAASYTAYLYFNFAGYMDIVIGLGLLLGQALPENFDHPFAARSFLEFWQRWHMTLSQWFRLYLFNPLLLALMARLPAPGLNATLGVVAFFVTFLVMGIWHGTTMVFVIYGLLMGAGASINKLWQLACAARLGKARYRVMAHSAIYAGLARGLTFAYFTLALTCLWVPDMARFTALVARLGAASIAGALLLLVLGFAVGAHALDAAIEWCRPRLADPAALLATPMLRNMWLAGGILAVLAIGSLFNKAPEFVYRAF